MYVLVSRPALFAFSIPKKGGGMVSRCVSWVWKDGLGRCRECTQIHECGECWEIGV